MIIILSSINLTYIYTLKIRKKLIITMYVFCIASKVTTACSVILFTFDPNGYKSKLQIEVFSVATFFTMCEALTLILTNFHLGTQIQYLRESITKDQMDTRNRVVLGFSILFAFGGSAGVGTEWGPGVAATALILVIYYTLTTKFLRMQLRTFKDDSFKDEIRSINC